MNKMENFDERYLYGLCTDKKYDELFCYASHFAREGYAAAQYMLAYCYYFGKGTKQNYLLSFEWHVRSAHNGNKMAKESLEKDYKYKNYMRGLFVTPIINKEIAESFSEAITDSENGNGDAHMKLAKLYEAWSSSPEAEKRIAELYSMAAEQGNTEAMEKLARCYEEGIGVKRNLKKALGLYEKSVTPDNAEILFGIAGVYEKAGDIGNAVEYYKAVTETTDRMYEAKAYFRLGVLGERWDPCKAEEYYDLAFKLFNELSKENNADADYYLGEMHFMGRGTPFNEKEAFLYYERAAKKSRNAVYSFVLAERYRAGEGVAENDKKAYLWFEEAAKRGDLLARAFCGYCCERGMGTRKNLKKAIGIYGSVILENEGKMDEAIAWAYTYLGMCYYHGRGVKRNKKIAMGLFNDAAPYNIVSSCYIKAEDESTMDYIEGLRDLAVIHFTWGARYIAPDAERGVELLKKKYEERYSSEWGLLTLARCYCTGYGTRKNKRKAIEILNNGLKYKSAKIYRQLGLHYFYSVGVEKNYEEALKCFEYGLYENDAVAALHVAYSYAKGYGVEKNTGYARRVIEKAAETDSEINALVKLLKFAGMWGYEKEEVDLTGNAKNQFLQSGLIFAREYESKALARLWVKAYLKTQKPALGIFDKLKIRAYFLPFVFLLTQAYVKKKSEGRNDEIATLREMVEILKIQVEMSERMEGTVNDVSGTVKSIDAKLDALTDFVKNGLVDYLKRQKEEIEAHITESAERHDARISEFIEKNARYINGKCQNMCPDELYETEKNHLEQLFGDKWDSMDEFSRQSLVSAGVLWKQTAEMRNEDFDYSGICISATAALEMELKRCLYYGFQNFAQSWLGKPSWKKWPHALLKKKWGSDKTLNEKGDSFTLGSLPFVTGKYDQDKNNPDTEQDMLLRYWFNEYLKVVVYDEKKNNMPTDYFYKKGDDETEDFVSACEKVTKRYRNPAAHTKMVDKTTAENCCKEVIGKVEALRHTDEIKGILIWLYEIIDPEKLNKVLNGQ